MDQNPTASYLTLDSFHFQERKLFISYFPGSSVGKDFACSAGDLGSSPGSERSPGEENGYPLQYSCLGNSTDRGAWWAIAHGVAKELDVTTNTTSHTIQMKSRV